MALQLDHDALVAAVEAAASGGATAVGVPAGGLNVAMPNVEAPVDASPDVPGIATSAPDPGQGAPLPVEPPAPTPTPTPTSDPTAPFLSPTSQPPAQMPWSPQAAGLPPGAAPPPDANVPAAPTPASPAPPADLGIPTDTPTPPADSTTPTPPPLDINKLYRMAMGRDPGVEDVVQTLDISTRLAALPDESRAWVNAIMSGQLNPRELESALQELDRLKSAPPAYLPPPTPTAPTPNPLDYDPFNPTATPPAAPASPLPDPRIEFERAQLERERQQFAQQQQEFQRRRNQELAAGVQGAWSEFNTSHPDLSIEEREFLQLRANQSPLFGALIQSGADGRTAMKQTIDHTILNTPEIRDRILNPASNAPPTAEEIARQTAANALATTSSGAAGPMGPSAPPRPANPLSNIAIPSGMAQGPVAPGTSPLAPATPGSLDPNVDLTNRNTMQQVIAQQIASMTQGR